MGIGVGLAWLGRPRRGLPGWAKFWRSAQQPKTLAASSPWKTLAANHISGQSSLRAQRTPASRPPELRPSAYLHGLAGDQVFGERPFRRDCSCSSSPTNATSPPSLPWHRQDVVLLVVAAMTLKVVLVDLILRAPILVPPKGINQNLSCSIIMSLPWYVLLGSV